MSPSDGGKVQARLRRGRFGVVVVLALAVIVIGIVAQRGCSPQAREVKELRCAVNEEELHGSYEWYSPTNILVLRRERTNATTYSLNVATGVKSEFEWLIPYVSKEDLEIEGWAISWPLQRLSVVSHTIGDTKVKFSSYDLKKQLEQHVDVEEIHRYHVYLPWMDSWASMVGSAKEKESLRFYTPQKGVTETKASPKPSLVDRGGILGRSEKWIFVGHWQHDNDHRGTLEIDALRLGDVVTIEKHYTLSLTWLPFIDDAAFSPDGKWLLVQGRVDPSAVGFTDSFPFVLPNQAHDVIFSAINLETSSIIKILQRITPPLGATHTPRWLPDGKSVSIIVDGELRVWKLFE